MTEKEYKSYLKKNFGKCRRTDCPFYGFESIFDKNGKEIEHGEKFHICHKNEDMWGTYYIMGEYEINKEDLCICQKKEDYVNWQNLGSDIKWDEKEKHYMIKNSFGGWSTGWIDENGFLYTETAGS